MQRKRNDKKLKLITMQSCHHQTNHCNHSAVPSQLQVASKSHFRPSFTFVTVHVTTPGTIDQQKSIKMSNSIIYGMYLCAWWHFVTPRNYDRDKSKIFIFFVPKSRLHQITVQIIYNDVFKNRSISLAWNREWLCTVQCIFQYAFLII